MISIQQAINNYLQIIKNARSENTFRTYRNALTFFSHFLSDQGYDLDNQTINSLSVDTVSTLITELKYHSASTERLYLTALKGFYEFVVSENYGEQNLSKLNLTIKQRSRKARIRLPQFPRDEIEKVIDYAFNLNNTLIESESSRLQNLRDRSFIVTLADTGLRVHEACNLIRGDIDWNEGKSIILGKGNRESVIRFSTRSLRTIKDYLNLRAKLDGDTGKPLAVLPIFCRHDRGAGKKVLRITTATGRNIVSQRVSEALGQDKSGIITPHSFRHYFVTTVLRASNNLKLAQELARHQNIAVTQRYTHLSNDELDQGYWDIFDEK